jgi:hypothetical protein
MSRFCWLLVLAVIIFSAASLLSQDAVLQRPEPISPETEEIPAHLIGEMPIVRFDFSKLADLESLGVIPIDIVVGEEGDVVSAEIEGSQELDDSDIPKIQRETLRIIVKEAKDAALKLHFRPFEQGGHPVRASFEMPIPVRDIEREPGKRTPFPQVRDWNSVKIVLSRTGCFGPCPSYEVEVHGDGTVLYEGHANVAIGGPHRGSVSREAVLQIVEAFRAADYFSLKDKYMWGVTDNPTYTTSISVDGKKKQVVDYVGEQVGMPESVSKLEESIDRFAGVERWTKGNAETVPALMQEKFNFQSQEASTILANVTQIGNVDAVRALVAAGVVVSAKRTTSGLRPPGTALGNAAIRGDVEMLRALLSADLKDADMKTEALERAAAAGKIEAMRLLIQSGANPVASKVVIGAVRSGVPAVAEEILKFKPDVNGRGEQNETALIACIEGYHYKDPGVDETNVVGLLLDNGADPNLAKNDGKTPLIANSRDLDITKMLIAHGANVNAREKNGFTALMNAGTVELTRFLLQHGADPFAKTDRGETALDWAKQMNHKDKAALLEAAMLGKNPQE